MDIVELNKTNSVRHPWELARFEILFNLLNQHLPVSGETKIIVDIGCGDYYFAEQLLLRRSDVLIVGVDNAFSKEEIKASIQKRIDSKLHLFSNLNEAEFFLDEKKINAVLLLDVIEHVEDDFSFLKNISESKLIDKNTIFLISVPAYQFLYSQHDVYLNHFRRYTQNKLLRTINKAGLHSVSCGYFFSSLLPIRFFEKLLEKAGRRKKQKGIGEWKKNKFLTAAIKKSLLFEFKITKKLGRFIKVPGLSVYCICQKSV